MVLKRSIEDVGEAGRSAVVPLLMATAPVEVNEESAVAVSVVNVPVVDDTAPMVVPLMVPPVMVTFVDVTAPLTPPEAVIAPVTPRVPLIVALPDADRLVNAPEAGVLAPTVVPLMVPAVIAVPVLSVLFVSVCAESVSTRVLLAGIVVPLSVVVLFEVSVVNVAAAGVDPPITVLLIVPPAIATRAMVAVPSINKLRHELLDVPRSRALSVEGSKSVLNRAFVVMVSVLASPSVVLPLTVKLPEMLPSTMVVTQALTFVPSQNKKAV